MEDQVIFEQSFSSYGKHFPRIHQQVCSLKNFIRSTIPKRVRFSNQ